MASGVMLAVGLMQLLMTAFIVTRYPVGSELLTLPGSLLGTMTRRDRHLGWSHLDTTGVVRTKCSRIFLVAGLP